MNIVEGFNEINTEYIKEKKKSIENNIKNI